MGAYGKVCGMCGLHSQRIDPTLIGRCREDPSGSMDSGGAWGIRVDGYSKPSREEPVAIRRD